MEDMGKEKQIIVGVDFATGRDLSVYFEPQEDGTIKIIDFIDIPSPTTTDLPN